MTRLRSGSGPSGQGTSLVVVLVFLGLAVSGQPAAAEPAVAQSAALEEEAAKLLRKPHVLERTFAEEPFVGSLEAKSEPATVGRFFGKREYAGLRGNPLLGYRDQGGFAWVGKAVAWDGVVAKDPACRSITEKAWAAAARHVASAHGLRLDDEAPIRFEGACVAAALERQGRALPGVLIEARLTSPSGVLLYRIAVGKPTVEAAVIGVLDFLLSFALHMAGPHASR